MLRKRRDITATLVGMLVFLLGLGIILFAFFQAYGLFITPPSEALGPPPGEPLDINATIGRAMVLVFRILVLLAMTAIGSVIANRGIRLYSSGAVVEREDVPEHPLPENDRSRETDADREEEAEDA